MALALANRVQETATANTTVSFTLTGAVQGFQTFAVIGDTNTTYYSATDGAGNWEVGLGTYSTTGPTLTRTTIYASSNTNLAVTFSGTVNVFVAYPSGRSVNLDASGNVSALGTVSSGTWQGSTVGVAYGGTGVTTSSGANSVVLRDGNQNITVNRASQTNNTVSATGVPVSLNAASGAIQTFVGTPVGTQIVVAPDATTLAVGTIFTINNITTGTIRIDNFANITIGFVASGGAAQLILVDNTNVDGVWDIHAFLPEGVTWGTNALSLGSTVISGGTWQGGTIQPAYGGTGLTTFVGANNALYSTGANTLTAGVLPVAAGGSGTSSPSLVAGSNVSISGSWPNQTISASGGGGGGGGGVQVGDYIQANSAPTTGTWVAAGGYYSKATYPALAAKLGDIPDLISFEQNPAMNNLMYPLIMTINFGFGRYISDTDGVKMVFGATIANDAITTNYQGGFYTTDGENYLPCNLGPVNELRYLNNKWIGCGVDTNIMVSDDGINWSSPLRTTTNQPASVAFGNGVYICTTLGGSRYFVSPNATNWNAYIGFWDTALTFTFAQRTACRLERIRFANGRFVAVGTETSTSTGVIVSTTDGITWSGPGSLGAGAQRLYDVTYGNSIWVAVGAQGNIRTSPDGITWTLRASGFSYTYFKIIFANGLFVAVADSSIIRTSPDGITWTTQTTGLFGSTSLVDIVWTGSQFIVPVIRGGKYLTSPDGIAWTVNQDPEGRNAYYNVIHFNNKTTFLSPNYSKVLLGTTPKTIAYGNNNLMNLINGVRPSFSFVAFGAGVYVIVSDGGTLAYSNDGVTFTWVNIPDVNPFFNVQYLNGYFLAGTTGAIYYSTDGINWTRQSYTPATSASIFRFAFLSGVYVVCTSSSVGYSTNLTSWTSAIAGSTTYADVLFFPPASLLVAVGDSGAIQTSPDGITWTNRSTGFSGSYSKLIYASAPANRLVIMSSSATGSVWETADAITFTERNTGLSNGIADICWEAVNGFTAVEPSANPRVSSAFNGTSWTARQTFVNSNGFMSRVFADGLNRIIFLRDGGTILRTPDVGQTWSQAVTGLTNIQASNAPLVSASFVNGRWFAFYRGANTDENGGIETSLDTLTWRMIKPYPQNFTGVTKRIYQLGGINYVTSAQGLHYSNDQINWTRIDTVNVQATHMAYGNGIWLCLVRPTIMANSLGLSIVYKSTDGVNFSYASTINNITRAGAATGPVAADMVFASGRFVVFFSNILADQGINNAAFYSVDGVTWAPSSMPPATYGRPAIGTVASDGSTIIAAPGTTSLFASILRSTDGGQTFTQQGPAIQGSNYVVYSNGLFVLSASPSYISTNGIDWVTTTVAVSQAYAYVNNDAIYSISRYNSLRTGRNGNSGNFKGYLTQEIPTTLFPSATVAKGADRLLVPTGFSAVVPNPNFIAELKLYSYNTATTFFVPQATGLGLWVYAGP